MGDFLPVVDRLNHVVVGRAQGLIFIGVLLALRFSDAGYALGFCNNLDAHQLLFLYYFSNKVISA